MIELDRDALAEVATVVTSATVEDHVVGRCVVRARYVAVAKALAKE